MKYDWEFEGWKSTGLKEGAFEKKKTNVKEWKNKLRVWENPL